MAAQAPTRETKDPRTIGHSPGGTDVKAGGRPEIRSSFQQALLGGGRLSRRHQMRPRRGAATLPSIV